MKRTTDLANTSISTERLVEMAILGLETRIMDLINEKASAHQRALQICIA